MRRLTLLSLFVCVFAGTPVIHADQDFIDCSKDSLADAVKNVKAKDLTSHFTGVCGPIVIATDGLTLEGVGSAVIDGGGQNAVMVAGVNRVSLSSAEVRNGLNGIVAIGGAHVTLTGVNVHDNAVFGITVQTASSPVLSDVILTHHGLRGLGVH